MADLAFILDSDETAVLELKLGQYIIGDKGDIGQAGPPGPEGSLTPDDTAALEKAVSDASASASAAAGSATSAGQSATSAAGSAANAKTSETNSAASASAAAGSNTAAGNSAAGAQAAASAAGASQTAAKTSETNSAASATVATQQATQAGNSATQAAASNLAAAGSANSADASAQAAAASAGTVNPANFLALAGGTMKGPLSMGVSGNYSNAIYFGPTGPVLSYNNQSKNVYFSNTANSAQTVAIDDYGTTTASGGMICAGSDGLGAFHSRGNIGGSFVDWNANNQRPFALQVDAQDASAAYGGIRWTRWGGRHIAAIDAYEGGSDTSACCIMFQIAGYQNAWNFGGTDIVRGAGGYVLGTWNHAAVMAPYVERIEALEVALKKALARLDVLDRPLT